MVLKGPQSLKALGLVFTNTLMAIVSIFDQILIVPFELLFLVRLTSVRFSAHRPIPATHPDPISCLATHAGHLHCPQSDVGAGCGGGQGGYPSSCNGRTVPFLWP